ncbi:unnamed protein product [Eruca vesicaria subsp. sativa]|uniref:F-box domain-containing protein n=1 Tax=Eruca vesicaria subsp. sativa TaxID=29727 RepID=A0ABC8JNE6_ERUVS|nr:unnamed protein product [Eruca vesicaria subsp. sativa]
MERQERFENIPKWEEMDKDILASIFKKLDVVDVIMGASRVCIAWFLASNNKTIWNTINLNDVDSIVPTDPYNDYFIPPNPWPYLWDYKNDYNNNGEKHRYELKEILIEINKFSRAAPWSGSSITTSVRNFAIQHKIMFRPHLEFEPDYSLILFHWGRLPNIRKLALPIQTPYNLYLFASSFSKWKNLQTLIIGNAKGGELKHMLEAIAENCRNITNLKFTYTLDQELANIILDKLPNLKSLSLRCTYVFIEAVKSLIIGLHNLKRLNLSHCLSNNGMLTQSLGMLPEDKSVILSIQKLETLKLCCCSDCTICQDVLHWKLGQYFGSESGFSHFWDNQWETDEFKEFEF